MPSVVESQTFYYGVDASSDVLSRNKRAFFSASAINRASSRLLNETRPPFDQFDLLFSTEEEKETFEKSAISGVFMYEGSPPSFSSFLICAVGDMILCGQIRSNSIEFRHIYKGIDPKWHHSFFCQALNILVWQNGKDYPLYWTGNPNKKMDYVVNSAYVNNSDGEARPMMIGNLMVYAHGRIFLATEDDLVYASDYILAQGLGLEQRESVLRFSESSYPSSGDGFGSPAELGSITGMMVMPRSNEINGHGDVIVLCDNGAWSISPGSVPRNEWTDADIQKILFVGKGCVAPNSIVHFNNGIYYRNSDNGISNVLRNIYSYTSLATYYDISDEIFRYLQFDSNSIDVKFCHASLGKKRMLFSVGHEREQSSNDKGVHRYGKGIVSYCFQKREEGYSGAWEGLWTGPRPAGMVHTILDGGVRSIIFSYDSDDTNRIYFLNEVDYSRGSDYRLGGYTLIDSTFVISDVFFDQNQNGPMVKKKLDKVEYFLDESNGVVTGSFSPDSSRVVSTLEFNEAEFIGCGKGSLRSTSANICHEIRDDNNRVFSDAYMFDFHINSKGYTKFLKLSFAANVNPSSVIETEKCNDSVNPGFSFCFGDNKCYEGFLSSDFTYTF